MKSPSLSDTPIREILRTYFNEMYHQAVSEPRIEDRTVAAINQYIAEEMLRIVGEDEVMPPTKLVTKFSKPTSVDYRNSVRAELRKAITTKYGGQNG